MHVAPAICIDRVRRPGGRPADLQVSRQTLNTTTTAAIAALDWAPSGLSADEIAECTQDLMTPSGLLIAGYRYNYTVNGTAAQGRTVTAAFQQITLTP